jgi:hypothetical protein
LGRTIKTPPILLRFAKPVSDQEYMSTVHTAFVRPSLLWTAEGQLDCMCTSTGHAETQRVDRVSGRKPSECGWGGRGALTASRSKISANGFAMALRSRPEPLRLPPHLEHRRPACGVNAASSESKAGRLQSTHFPAQLPSVRAKKSFSTFNWPICRCRGSTRASLLAPSAFGVSSR